MTKSLNDNDFTKDVLESSLPVLVDFWAEWCGPCRMLAPILDEISQDLSGKVTVFKMNVDENPSTPSTLGIRSIPTLMLFKQGKLIGTKVGASEKSSLVEWINSLI